MIGVGEKFPAFELQGVNEHNEFVKVSVSESYEPLKHDYTVVYFYPKDFTFICPTEIAGMDILVDEANVIGISGDIAKFEYDSLLNKRLVRGRKAVIRTLAQQEFEIIENGLHPRVEFC